MNFADPKTLRALLERHGVTARKGLGQHFLCSSRAVDAVLEALAGTAGVLEIGPGPGVLTAALSESCAKVIALEVDVRMVGILAESAPKAEVRQLDALKVDLRTILAELPEPRAVVSNLPYYITGPLVTRIAEAAWTSPNSASSPSSYGKSVLMMQSEVARKIVAEPGNRERGSLSVYLQALFEIRKLADVPPGAFLPPPKVSSMILEFVPRSPDRAFTQSFFAFVRQGFKQPRKALANNLAGFGGLQRENIDEALSAANLKPLVRPHELSLESWLAIRRSFENRAGKS